MNPVAYIAAPYSTPPPPPGAPETSLEVSLEAIDGTRRVVLDDGDGFRHMPGSSGLEMPPVSVATGGLPAAFGSVVRDVRVEERPVFIPIFVSPGSSTQDEHLARMDLLRSIVNPLTGMFRIVCATHRSERELEVVYTGGLEGDDSPDANGLTWAKVGLTAVASQPFASARTLRTLEFGLASAPTPFLGAVGGTDAPWPPALATSSVIGSNMLVRVASEVPVYPTVELVGPMDSFTGSLAALEPATNAFGGPMGEWSVSIPAGVPAGQTLRIVTDPRARSIRLDGALAAGRVARGSKLRPFYPGVNVLNVAAPGGTEATRVRLSWTDLFRSLW